MGYSLLFGFGYWLLVIGCGLLTIDYWLVVSGYWLLVVRNGLLVMGYWFLVTSTALEHAGAAPRNCRGSGGGTPPVLQSGLGGGTPPNSKFKNCVLGGNISFLIIETK